MESRSNTCSDDRKALDVGGQGSVMSNGGDGNDALRDLLAAGSIMVLLSDDIVCFEFVRPMVSVGRIV
jgi:hypothetical protein